MKPVARLLIYLIFVLALILRKPTSAYLSVWVNPGAMDALGPRLPDGAPNRAVMFETLPEAIKAAEQHAKAQALGQDDLFGLINEEPEDTRQSFKEVPPWPEEVWLDGEKETLGLYLTGHPINRYLAEVKHYASSRIVGVQPTGKDKSATVVGLVIGVRVLVNKRGKRWALVTLDEKSARMDVRLFPDDYETFQELLVNDAILVCSGQVSFDDYSGGYTMSGRDIMTIADARENYVKYLDIKVDKAQVGADFIDKFTQVLSPYKDGTCPIRVFYQREEAEGMLELGVQWRVTPADMLLHELRILLGDDNVALQFD